MFTVNGLITLPGSRTVPYLTKQRMTLAKRASILRTIVFFLLLDKVRYLSILCTLNKVTPTPSCHLSG